MKRSNVEPNAQNNGQQKRGTFRQHPNYILKRIWKIPATWKSAAPKPEKEDMKSKWNRTLAFTASIALCSMTLLYVKSGTLDDSMSDMAAEGDVTINAEHFPDEIFRNYVDTEFDTTDDDVLTAEEAASVGKSTYIQRVLPPLLT